MMPQTDLSQLGVIEKLGGCLREEIIIFVLYGHKMGDRFCSLFFHISSFYLLERLFFI